MDHLTQISPVGVPTSRWITTTDHTEPLAERHLSNTLKPNQQEDPNSLICAERGQSLAANVS